MNLVERGRERFAGGRFFEAHQAWELAWREESGQMRLLLHGLILAAAAYHKMAAYQQPRGMVRLLERALEELQPLPSDIAGLELDRFRQGLDRSLLEAREWLDGAPAPSGPAPLGTRIRSRPAGRAAAGGTGA